MACVVARRALGGRVIISGDAGRLVLICRSKRQGCQRMGRSWRDVGRRALPRLSRGWSLDRFEAPREPHRLDLPYRRPLLDALRPGGGNRRVRERQVWSGTATFDHRIIDAADSAETHTPARHAAPPLAK